MEIRELPRNVREALRARAAGQAMSQLPAYWAGVQRRPRASALDQGKVRVADRRSDNRVVRRAIPSAGSRPGCSLRARLARRSVAQGVRFGGSLAGTVDASRVRGRDWLAS